MSRSFDDITAIMLERRDADHPMIRQMQLTKDKYNGDAVTLLPGVKGEPEMVPPIAQIVTDAVDFLAHRSSGPKPTLSTPSLDQADEAANRRASDRRTAFYASWYENALAEVLLRRAYRHYYGYGTFAMVAMPDPELGVRVELRDPLATYPEMRTPDDIHCPLNVGFVYGRSPEWIAKRYPETRAMMIKSGSWGRMWDMVEWIDEDDVVVGILGPRFEYGNTNYGYDRGLQNHMELRRWPNRAGFVPAAIPRRVTLDRVMGQVWAAVGQQTHLERFTALEITAAEKYVFPDMVVVGRDGRTPMLVSGQWKDGRSGEANFIQDGDVKLLNAAPGVLTMPTLDRIQENAMKTAGLVPQSYAQSYGSLRTGRAIDTMGSYAVDPRIQEGQEIVARHLSVLNEGIAAVFKGYFPRKRFKKFSGWPGHGGHVEFTPSEVFDTAANVVSYPFPGSDVSEISVAVSQLVSTRLISRTTGRHKHPWIENPDFEDELIVKEQMEDAVLQAHIQGMMGGQIPIIDGINALEAYMKSGDLLTAFREADDAARQRQAAQAPPPGPGQAIAPEQAPGLAQPGMGAETIDQQLPTQGPPPQAIQNGAQLIRALRAGTQRG